MSAFNTYPGKKNQGRDFNHFQRVAVSNTTFGVEADGYKSDVVIKFPTVNGGVMFTTEGSSTNTVEYSFNGNTVHGELIPNDVNRRHIVFYHRPVSMVWFRVKSGSTGPINIVVEAWSGA